MPENVLQGITRVFEARSQMGPAYTSELPSYDAVVNAFLASGWMLINTYIEGRGHDSGSEECVCLLGWAGDTLPQYPTGYSPR